jgi:hypothetical protein
MLAKAQSLKYHEYVLSKKKKLTRKWKREYYRFIDGVVRSHGIQKFFMRLLYLLCFVATVILAALLYVNS